MFATPRQFGCLIVLAAVSACSPNYSQTAASIASGVSNIKAYSNALQLKRSADREFYYGIEANIHKTYLQATASCGDVADLSDCYIGDKKELASEPKTTKKPGAGTPGAGNPVIGTAGSPSAPVPGIPPVCLSFIQNGAALATQKATVGKEKQAATEPKIIDALTRYAQGLAAITKSSDSAAYKAAAAKLSSSVGTMTGTIGTLAGGPAGGIIAGAVGKAIASVGLQANLIVLQANRAAALRQALLSACLPVYNLTNAETVILSARYEEVYEANHTVITELLARQKLVHEDPKDQAAMVKAAANLRALGPDPGDTVGELATVHSALADAVTTGKGQTPE
jgi:hypothetical protein